MQCWISGSSSLGKGGGYLAVSGGKFLFLGKFLGLVDIENL